MPTDSRYQVLHHMTEKLHEALLRQGIESRILDRSSCSPQAFLSSLLQFKPDCTFTFNATEPNAEGRFLCDLLAIPHLAVLVDSPNHLFTLIKGNGKALEQTSHTILSCPDRFSCRLFRQLCFERVFFLPHAVESDLCTDPAQERRFPVSMLCSCIDFEQARKEWHAQFPALKECLDEAAERALAAQELSCIAAFAQAMELEHDGVISKEILAYYKPIELLERYVRGVDRTQLVRSITSVPVHLFGADAATCTWNALLKDCPNITIHPPVPFEEALSVMQNSKIVLNSSSWIREGGHERLFSASACGALVLTTEDSFLKNDYTDGEEMLFYRYERRHAIDETLSAFLAADARRVQCARQGQRITLQKHTWDKRAATLLKHLKAYLGA